MIRRILVGVVVVFTLAFAGFSIYVASRQNLKFDAPFPSIAATADSAVVARGRYLVRVLGPCAKCHGAPDPSAAASPGAEVPLSGGYEFDLPFGKFRVPNITPDSETGIGRFSDGALARALRNNIRHDGRALLPFMEYQGLSDEDLVAVISYLRSQPPVPNRVPDHEPSLLGRVLLATMLSNPIGPKSPPPATSPRGISIETGRYLVESVALCGACHSQTELNGELSAPRLSGTKGMEEPGDTERLWNPPNLTNDPATGKLAQFDEDGFVARMRAGTVIPGSPMPWQNYQRMDEADLRAIYRYLASLPAAVNDVGPPFTAKPK